ncbi:putative F-box/kelch-repeat protein At4g39756 isoform X1 [Raphanus sativus]|uniref:F-box/kelch-repeat protein At4g39756 isoform X1 n=2 Tax=Raphanus sativus TaxID=3726 RepID=A0A6J0LIA8_RAPSA|nr:putative F-box/kelch-repeat protein At4g39756 isoform X1 [Raphanus sativus]
MEREEARPQTKLLCLAWYALKITKGYLHHYLLTFFTLILGTFSTFSPTTTTMNTDVEPPSSHPSSFLSLPDDVVLNCLARISRSYYPKLSLVSKTFHSLIISSELSMERCHVKTTEALFYVCLQLPDHVPSWYSLWIKPDQILTNDMEEDYNKSTGNTLLVGIPSTHIPTVDIGLVGSKFYKFLPQKNSPAFSRLYFGNNFSFKARHMMLARNINAVAGSLDGKIYVMGGCSANESTSWAEVFDTTTQVWESLPDPGPELRSSSIKALIVTKGKVYVERSSEDKYFFYDPILGRWGVAENRPAVEMRCVIEDVVYSCDRFGCFWYDTKHNQWMVVHGLEVFNRNRRGGIIALANYCGKLLILWDRPGPGQNKNIWCSVIALERRDEVVWGHVEWTSVVLTVPSSYRFLRCKVKSG